MVKGVTNTRFYETHQSFRPQKGSLLRRIGEVALKIFCSFWRSLGSYFRTVDADISNYSGEYDKTVKQFHKKRMIGGMAVQTYACDVIRRDNIQIVSGHLDDLGRPKLPKAEDGKNLILIPVILNGFLRDHIVAVAYDKTANRVELYDSKGLTAKDRSNRVFGTDGTLEDLLVKVAEKYGDAETTLWENTERHQYDSHNCGIYVLHYMKERAAGKAPDTISLTFDEANESKRAEFIHDLTAKKS